MKMMINIPKVLVLRVFDMAHIIWAIRVTGPPLRFEYNRCSFTDCHDKSLWI